MKTLILILCLIPLTTYGNWKTIKTENMPIKRHENGLVAIDEKIILIGGRKIKTVETLNTTKLTWVTETQTPIEMHHITPIAYKNDIWIITGLTGNYPQEEPLDMIYKYDTDAKTWHNIMSIPKERRRGAAGVTIHEDKIYIVGGIKNGHTSGTTNYVDVFDITHQTWETLPDAPHIRDHNNVVVLNNKLIALGGRNTSVHHPKNFTAFFQAVVDNIDIYDIEKREWKTLPITLPIPAAGAGAIAHKNNIYFIGGENQFKPAIASVYQYNLEKNKWKELAPLNTGRHGTNLVLIKDHLYIGAGSGRQGGRPELTSIEKLQLR